MLTLLSSSNHQCYPRMLRELGVGQDGGVSDTDDSSQLTNGVGGPELTQDETDESQDFTGSCTPGTDQAITVGIWDMLETPPTVGAGSGVWGSKGRIVELR